MKIYRLYFLEQAIMPVFADLSGGNYQEFLENLYQIEVEAGVIKNPSIIRWANIYEANGDKNILVYSNPTFGKEWQEEVCRINKF